MRLYPRCYSNYSTILPNVLRLGQAQDSTPMHRICDDIYLYSPTWYVTVTHLHFIIPATMAPRCRLINRLWDGTRDSINYLHYRTTYLHQGPCTRSIYEYLWITLHICRLLSKSLFSKRCRTPRNHFTDTLSTNENIHTQSDGCCVVNTQDCPVIFLSPSTPRIVTSLKTIPIQNTLIWKPKRHWMSPEGAGKQSFFFLVQDIY